MRKIGSLVSGLLLILVFIVSIVFSHSNTTPVSLVFGNRELSPQPVSVWIIGAFAVGACIGLLWGLGILRGLRSRLEIRRLNKQLSQARRELNQLRAMSSKELE